MNQSELLANCQTQFTKSLALSKGRLDSRELNEWRELKIEFLKESGGARVWIGETLVMAQTTCEIVEPTANRPHEGRLFIDFSASPMAAPYIEMGRSVSDSVTEITRVLDRVIKSSECLNLENLCISNGTRVWAIRIDVTLLNAAGNVLHAASIAAVASLATFRHPDVTIDGTEVFVHDPLDREPIPLHIYHYPYAMAFAFYQREDKEQQPLIMVDPTELEERCADGQLIIGINSHLEVSALHQRGCALKRDLILMALKHAAARAENVTALLKKRVAEYEASRTIIKSQMERRVGDEKPMG